MCYDDGSRISSGQTQRCGNQARRMNGWTSLEVGGYRFREMGEGSERFVYSHQRFRAASS
jgi:hypothetical protein